MPKQLELLTARIALTINKSMPLVLRSAEQIEYLALKGDGWSFFSFETWRMEQRGYILTDDKQSDCHSHLTSLIGRNLEKIEFPVFGNIVDFCFNFDSELSIRIFGQIGPETWVYNAVDGQVYTGPYWNF